MSLEDNEYKHGDFVQVGAYYKVDSGEKIWFWQNALYFDTENDGHCVIYADGFMEVIPMIHAKDRIRRPKFN